MSQTEINKQILMNAPSLEKVKLEGMMDDDLGAALSELFARKHTNASQIATITGISRSYITELQKNKRNHKNPSRKLLVSICLAAKATLEETDHVLKTARVKELYARDKVDAIIIWGLAHGKDYYQIMELLSDYGHDDLMSE